MIGNDLIELPWTIQVALGSGYAAYMLAYVGIRGHHKTIDIAFKAIAFSAVAAVVLVLTEAWHPVASAFSALLAALFASAIWRFVGMNILRRAFRSTDLSWSDDSPNAWTHVFSENADYPVTQMSVLLDDGVWLCNRKLGEFEHEVFGPCILGHEGDVAMYVTERVEPDGTIKAMKSVKNEKYGSRLTYIPATFIKRMTVRFVRKRNI